MTRTPPPSAEQLDRLVDAAGRRRLTPDEDAALRAGVRQLRASLAGAGAAVRRAPSGAYVAQLQRQAARASRYRAAWQSARRRARRLTPRLAAVPYPRWTPPLTAAEVCDRVTAILAPAFGEPTEQQKQHAAWTRQLATARIEAELASARSRAIEDGIKAAAVRITRSDPAEELTVHPYTLNLIRDMADRSGHSPIPIGSIVTFAGLAVVCDVSVPVGEVRVQPRSDR